MEKVITPSSVLTWGIVALVFCSSPILGLIFAIIAFSKAKKFAAGNLGPVSGQAKVGSIFAKISLPISIVMQVVWIIYVIVVGAAVAYMM